MAEPITRTGSYHTGKERAVVGLAEVASPPYPDPRALQSGLIVVDVIPRGPLPRPVTLAEISMQRL